MIAILFLIFIVLLVMGLPVVFSMGISSLIYSLFFCSSSPIEIIIAHRISFALYSWPLLAIPFFITAGLIMNNGGITKRIFTFVNSLVGHITGGLGHVNVVASLIFAGMSGSAAADCGGLGQIEMEAMNKAGYDPGFSAAISAASACIGPIFPPSISLILYGIIAEQSIIKLFAGGILPGIIMSIMLMVVIYILAKSKKIKCPVTPRAPILVVWRNFKEAFFALLLPIIILGCILSGVTTPTETGIIACVYALVLGFCYGELKLSEFPTLFKEISQMIAVPMFIIAMSYIFSWLVILEQLPQFFSVWMLSITENPIIILFGLSIIMFIAGCFMEPTAILLIMAPIFIPLAKTVGINLIHLGLIMSLNMTIATMTPPVGMGLFILSNISNVKIERIFIASIPFIGALMISLIVIILFPQTVLFLANIF